MLFEEFVAQVTRRLETSGSVRFGQVSNALVEKILKMAAQHVVQVTHAGGTVTVPKFGAFRSKYRRARSVRTPKGKEAVMPSHTVVQFKAFAGARAYGSIYAPRDSDSLVANPPSRREAGSGSEAFQKEISP